MTTSTKVLIATTLPDLKGISAWLHALSRDVRGDRLTYEDIANAIAVIQDRIDDITEEMEALWARTEGEPL